MTPQPTNIYFQFLMQMYCVQGMREEHRSPEGHLGVPQKQGSRPSLHSGVDLISDQKVVSEELTSI